MLIFTVPTYIVCMYCSSWIIGSWTVKSLVNSWPWTLITTFITVFTTLQFCELYVWLILSKRNEINFYWCWCWCWRQCVHSINKINTGMSDELELSDHLLLYPRHYDIVHHCLYTVLQIWEWIDKRYWQIQYSVIPPAAYNFPCFTFTPANAYILSALRIPIIRAMQSAMLSCWM